MSKAKSFVEKFGNHPWVVFILAVYGLGQMLASFTGMITDMNIPGFLILESVADWIGAITNVILVTIIYFVLKAFTRTREEMKQRDEEREMVFFIWGAMNYRQLTDLAFTGITFSDQKTKERESSKLFVDYMQKFQHDYWSDFHRSYPEMSRAEINQLFEKAFPFYGEFLTVNEDIEKL